MKRWMFSTFCCVLSASAAVICISSKSPVLFILNVFFMLANGAIAVQQYHRGQ